MRKLQVKLRAFLVYVIETYYRTPSAIPFHWKMSREVGHDGQFVHPHLFRVVTLDKSMRTLPE